MPRIYTKRKMTESQEQDIGKVKTREFAADSSLPKPKIEPQEEQAHQGVIEVASMCNIRRNADGKIISNPTRGKKWMDEMAFMEEIVTVRVHTTTDKNANPIPDIYVNGRVQRFLRGHEQKVKRLFLAKLAQSQVTSFDCQLVKDHEGQDKYVYPGTSAEIYPFTVIGDTPKGDAWLKGLMRQTA
jgi:hypothetical protein